MNVFVFPGQGAQFPGMGKDLFDSNEQAQEIFAEADEILAYKLSDVMFNGSAEDLKETKVTQPAIYLHSMLKVLLAGNDFQPDAVAGHSLGEFSALAASGAISFKEGLQLVQKRANAMQKACELSESTMAAIVGLDDEVIEEVCNGIDEVVVPANYNCPKQLVISGTVAGIEKAVEALNEKGARRALMLQVGGAFHSPLMEPAKKELEQAILGVEIQQPKCPIYQNVTALPTTDPAQIKQNLIDQLTAPVRWTQTMQNMIADGATHFTEVGGNGKVLTGLLKKVDRRMPVATL